MTHSVLQLLLCVSQRTQAASCLCGAKAWLLLLLRSFRMPLVARQLHHLVAAAAASAAAANTASAAALAAAV